MKQQIMNLRERAEEALRKACGRMTPARRMIVVLIASTLFAMGCLWMTLAAIYNMGKERERRQFEEMRHIRTLFVPPPAPDTVGHNPSAPHPDQKSDKPLTKDLSDILKKLRHE